MKTQSILLVAEDPVPKKPTPGSKQHWEQYLVDGMVDKHLYVSIFETFKQQDNSTDVLYILFFPLA